jgi:hypothetical protein
MQEQPNEQPREWDVMEREAIYVLTDPERYPLVWSIPDMARQIETTDADAILRPLYNAGLIHRTKEGLVFATPAAFRMVQMVGHVV